MGVGHFDWEFVKHFIWHSQVRKFMSGLKPDLPFKNYVTCFKQVTFSRDVINQTYGGQVIVYLASAWILLGLVTINRTQ